MSQTTSQTTPPSIGRIVHYRLSREDADAINRRRTSGASISERIKARLWPLGAQAHIGKPAGEGDVLPLVVNELGAAGVGGQVLLRGNDQLWVCARPEGDGPGAWCWPPRVP